MKITFSGFAATAPKFDDEQLQDGYAVRSVNTRPGRGILEPWRAPLAIGNVVTAQPLSVFKYNTEWFSWPTLTHAVRAPLKNDAYDYVLISSEGMAPIMTDNILAENGGGPFPSATVPLGVEIPISVINVGAPVNSATWLAAIPTPAPEADEYDVSEVAYAYCYKDAYGRLSALSPLSASVSIKEYKFQNTNSVILTLPSPTLSLELTNAIRSTIAKILIYRTNYAGGSTGVLQFLVELPYTATTYTDEKYSGDLLDSPINTDWIPPPNLDTSLYPNGPMSKVCIMGSDTIVGHNRKLLCFAEPDAFYAFPAEYYKVFKENIFTIFPVGANLVVFTDMYPYIVQGLHPSSMDATRLSDPVVCMSVEGITEVAGVCFFVSSTGLQSLSGYEVRNVTRDYMTINEWAALGPATIKLANYDNRVFIDCPSLGFTYVYDPSNPTDGLRVVDHSVACYWQLETTNGLAYVPSGSNSIVEFDAAPASYRLLSWTSKTYAFNEPVNFCVMKVKANTYPVSVIIEAEKEDGGLVTKIVSAPSHGFVYLPFQGRAKRWRAKVEAVSPAAIINIRSIEIGQSPSEFA